VTIPPTQRTQAPSQRITIEAKVDDETARRFYALYVESFGELATKAVARQVLHEHEFMEEMLDDRVDKYLARDHGRVVAMCTLTKNLETVPWISPQYFEHHYPDHWRRDAVYYLGFVLVAHSHRRSNLFVELIRVVSETLVDRRAMCAYDICSYNNEIIGLSEAIETLLTSVAEISVASIDTQTYYRAIPLGPRKLPRMRNSRPASAPTLEAERS
jgi:hypothetical protein